jgi:hypothetical protein
LTPVSLPPEIQELVDREQIRALTAAYNRAADGVDPDALLVLFTADATVEMHGGADGVARFEGPEIARLTAPYQGQRVHLTTNSTIEIAGELARQRCSLLLCTRSRRRGLAAILTGSYEDELTRTAEGWRFARRIVHVDYANEARLTLAEVNDG